MKTENWGLISYAEAWKRQTECFDALVAAKQNGMPYENRLIFCQHPHVYTLGKHGKETNLLLDVSRLQQVGAELFRIDRGGDITYHGPGQIVCYPILNLEDFHLGLKEYAGATGVWIDKGMPGERKICAMGVRCSHFVTMHGLALNVSTDLRYFSYIHPCGFVDKGVTSIERETGHDVPFEEARKRLEIMLTELLSGRIK